MEPQLFPCTAAPAMSWPWLQFCGSSAERTDVQQQRKSGDYTLDLQQILNGLDHKLDALYVLIHTRLPPRAPALQEEPPATGDDLWCGSGHSKEFPSLHSKDNATGTNPDAGLQKPPFHLHECPSDGHGSPTSGTFLLPGRDLQSEPSRLTCSCERCGSEISSSASAEGAGQFSLGVRPGFQLQCVSPTSRRPQQPRSLSVVRWRSRQSICSEDPLPIAKIKGAKRRSRTAWNPDSRSRTLFEVLSMFLFLYDAFVMPYRLAWDVTVQTMSFVIMMWTTRIFWTFDLMLNLVTGFREKDAALELNLQKCMQNYLRTWFLPDLALVICDWATYLSLSDDRPWWIQRMRLMRVVRGGRQMLRGWNLVLKARLMIQAKGIHLAIDISLLLLVILWVNHVVCCGWYSIGRYSESDTGLTWLTNTGYPTGGVYWDYLTALHWSMTQMTPGSMEIVPESSVERIYSVATLFLGLLLGSSLIATLTSMMTQYKMRLEESSRKFAQLHQFLCQQRADPQLALAIKLQVKARSSEVARLREKDVEYMSFVPKSLQEALWHSWCMKHLSMHAFLNSLNIFDPVAMQTLCNTAIKTQGFPASDAIFEEGSQGNHMYVVVRGHLRYNPGEMAPECDWSDGDPKLDLNPGDWCCEPALWTVWTHLGTLGATSTAEVLCVDGAALPCALRHFPLTDAILSEYCARFHAYINEPGVLKSELAYGFNISELLWGLSSERRILLAQSIFHRLEVRFWGHFISQPNIDNLKVEVATGKCALSYEGAEAVRNTFVVALRVRKSTDTVNRFLVKIGEVLRDSDEVVPSCLLPGVKRKCGENYKSAVERLMMKEFQGITSQVETKLSEGCEQVLFTQPSPTYGIKTQYLRTTFPARLTSGVSLPEVRASKAWSKPSKPRGLMGLFRPAAYSMEVSVQQQTTEVLSRHQHAVVLHCGAENRASMKLYLWLMQDEFDVLSHEMAKPIIKQWAASLEYEQGKVGSPISATGHQDTDRSCQPTMAIRL